MKVGKKDICVICIHGMCGTIIYNYFATVLATFSRNIGFIYEPDKLLHKMIEDCMYMSSKTYYNWYNDNSELNNLPVISTPKNWNQFETIDVPILTFSGSKEEDYYLHLDLLKDKAIRCKNFEYKIIENTGHTYKNKETEIGNFRLD